MNSQQTASDFLLDLKALLQEFYVGTVTFSGTAIEVRFENGQAFLINVNEAQQ